MSSTFSTNSLMTTKTHVTNVVNCNIQHVTHNTDFKVPFHWHSLSVPLVL